MSLTLPYTTLSDAYGLCASIATSRAKAILQNVLLSGGALRATNLEQSIAVKLGCGAMEVLLPPSFGAILKETRSDITLSLDRKATLLVETGKSRYELPTGNPAEFPAFAQPVFTKAAVVPAVALRTLLARTSYAAEGGSSRYALEGVKLETSGDRLMAIATDGRRMAVSEAACTGELEKGIIPLAACKLLLRGLPDGDEPATVSLTNTAAYVQCGAVTLHTQLVEGRFPKWQDVFPKDSEATLDVVAGMLHAAVRQAAIATDKESQAVRFEFSEGTLRMSAQASNVGSSKIELPIALTGADVSIQLNPDFVCEALKAWPADTTVLVKLKDRQTAVVMEADGTRCVIMPMGS